MGVYVNLKCRSCGKSLTGGYVQNYAGIGEPLISCPKCHTVNSHADRCTEWQLMGIVRRIWLVIVLGFSTTIYYGFGGFVVAAVLLSKEIIGEIGFLATMIVVPGIGFTRLFLYFRRTIASSNNRMANPSYRHKLKSHGLG